ncbi:protein FAM188B-like, partial [Sinocyclocheilus rhinocerous]|uniref:protein FAM188B-like n=1 Tax=Sinocyclocheilus rhinocerous TaxID=307959 RepID=UPI0007B7A7FD
MMGKDVEEVSASLVREYLSRKGLKKTIACMDEELPRTNSSINNRSDLRRILHLEGLYKKNKTEEHPLKSMLEMIVKNRMSEGGKTKARRHGDNQTTSSSSIDTTGNVKREEDCMENMLCDSPSRLSESSVSQVIVPSQTPSEKLHKSFALHPESERSMYCSKEGFPSEKKVVDTDSQKNRSSRIRRGIMSGPIASSSQESNRRRPARKATPSVIATLEDCKEAAYWTNGVNTTNTKSIPLAPLESSMFSNLHTGIIDRSGHERTSDVKHRLNNSAPSQKLDELHVLEMVLDDIENEESLCDVSRTTMPELSLDKTPMDQMTATALKEIIFGSSMACFTEEWKQQNFTFSDTPGLKYGIVQKKGGPCGVLAAVQACVLQKLLFEESSNDSLKERLEVSNVLRTKCLSLALADMLWRAGNMKRATVAITCPHRNTGRSLFTPIGRYKSDGVLEMIMYVTVETLDDLTLVLEQHVRQ